jgi:transposase-like protein
MSRYNKHVYVPSSRQNPREAFAKAAIRAIVAEVERGASRKALCRQHGMSSTTLDEWMTRYGSSAYHQNKKKSFTKTHRNAIARAILEGRMSVGEAAVSNGVRQTTISSWVKQKLAEEAAFMVANPEVMPSNNTVPDKAIADELARALLKIKALETMIDIAEQEFKICIRKKSGAKQSFD